MATPENPFAFDQATAATIAVGLLRRGEVLFGDYALRDGSWSPIYVDLRTTPSALDQNPDAPTMTKAEQLQFRKATVQGYGGMLDVLDGEFEHVAAIPEAVTGLGPMVAYDRNASYLHRRIQPKEYGRPSDGILGNYAEGDRVVMLDDLISSSGAKVDEKKKLEDISRPGKETDEVRGVGLVVEHALILLDRETGGIEAALKSGLEVHAGITISQVLDIGLAEGEVSDEDYKIAAAYRAGDLRRPEDKHLFL